MSLAISSPSQNTQSSGAPTHSFSLGIMVPALLLLLYVAQCVWFIRTQSLTYDEPVHIAEGLESWRNGRFEQYNDHPPLARLLCSVPLVSSKWQVDVAELPEGFQVHRILPGPISLSWRARAVNVCLGLLLGVLLWFEVSSLFSRGAANFVLALFAFSPSLIAHFSLVTTDGAATLMIFAAAMAVRRWVHKPGWKAALGCGAVFGLLLLAKFSTPAIFVLAVGWMLVMVNSRVSFRPAAWNWARVAAAIVIAFWVVWAGYFFHISRLSIHNGVLSVTHPNWSQPLVKPTRFRWNISLPVPAGEYIAGLREVALHNAHGQPAFFLGHISRQGWKAYYPLTVLLKWPLVVLVLATTGLILCLLRKVRMPDFWVLLSFPAVYFLLAIFSHFNIGERHILPVYPFALVCCAAAWQNVSRSRYAAALAIALTVFNAADALRYAPGYLSYFDIFVPPAQTYKLLSDSNVDWGQGLIALRHYQDRHPNEQISLAYFGSVDPHLYGVRARILSEDEPATGTVVVSANNLSGQYLRDPHAYQWLLRYPRIAILDHCLYVFQVGPGTRVSP